MLFVIVTVLLPVLAAIGGVVDLIRWLATRRPWMSVRLIAFVWVFLAVETVGLLRFFAHWVRAGFGRRPAAMIDPAWRAQRWWAHTLLAAVRRLFRIDLDIADLDVSTPGPIVAMFRHASIVDTLLPATLLGGGRGLQLRWVLKRELLSLPALDVAGLRLPNYFVDRDADDARNEIRRIRSLAEELGAGDGVMIYPEGTRFTEAKRERALGRLRTSSPDLASRAEGFRHVLPPRIGGPLTLLGTGYDVVVCAHEGLGGFAHLRDVWSGALVGRTVHVKFWRIPAASIPQGRKARIEWLFDQWQLVDDWVAATKAARGEVTLPGASHPPTPS